MVDINDLVVCPVCHSDLSLDGNNVEKPVCCPGCKRRYSLNSGVYNMTPVPPADELLRSKWDTWQKLQDNGLLSYTTAPEFNLSVGLREDALAFRSFCQPSGLILDIGCGPQAYSSYLPEVGQVVGIDPLLGRQPRGFAFVQGIGEYLPFRDETFDQILYASSLDHIMNPRRSLAEAVRCVKRGGKISLWIDGLADDDSEDNQSTAQRYRTLATKGFKSLSRHSWLKKIGLRRTVSYVVSVAKMKVPEGASDCFHFSHLNVAAVLGWLTELSLSITAQQDYPEADSYFIQARK
jgi:SAM-dependent methyltransferase